MSRSIDSSSVRRSAIVDADTQFDLDLADVLDQYPDGAVRGAGGAGVEAPTAPAAPAAAPADVAPFVGVVPLGDPWVVAPAADGAVARPRPTPFGEVVAVANAAAQRPAPPADPVADPPATAVPVPTSLPAPVDRPTAVDEVPVPHPTVVAPVPVVGAADGAAGARARAVDPPTSVHSVFVTPPAGTPVVSSSGPSAAAAAPAAGADRRTRRRARRRSRVVVVLAGVLALALVGAGVGLAVATRDGGGADEAAASPGQAVALPPADAAKPDDDDAAAPAPEAPVVDPAEVQQAADTVTTFLSVRGTDAERAVSSRGGRDQLDAALAASGATSVQGAPQCAAGGAAGTFACVLDTDQGDLTLTVGADPDDPASSGFEVIAATL